MKKIIRSPFANIYEEASFSSQIITQAVISELAEVLDTRGDWLLLRLPTGHEGWTQNFSTVDCDEETEEKLNRLSKLMIHTPFLPVYAEDELRAQRITVLAMGAEIPYLEKKEDKYKILLPDGRQAFIRQEAMSLQNPREIILSSAERLLGASYFWGGRTENGCDCSGLVQMCFKIAGISLPHQASRQIRIVEERPLSLEEAQAADLAFFQNEKGRISHVAIMRKTPEYIHASGEVKINSFDPRASNYLKKLDDMLKGIYSIENLL